jgi:hypothetical protein
MSIKINNQIINAKKLPAIYNNIDSDAGPASQYPDGFLLIDTPANRILINDGASWVDVTSGTFSAPTLDQVVAAGNDVNDGVIIVYDTIVDTSNTIGGSFISINLFPNVRLTQYYDRLEIVDYSTTNRQTKFFADQIQFEETTGFIKQNLKPNSSFSGQVITLPESTGTIALQDEPLQASINSSPFTPIGNFNKIYRVVAGASSIVLNPANWVDRKTLTFCFDVTAVTFSVTGGATLRGIALINNTGLYYVTYLSSANTFYLSHTA